MKSHRLLDGRRVDLGKITARQNAFLSDLQIIARRGVSYFEVYRAAVGPGSLALQGRNRIDQQIVESPFYLVARDIATRAGIRQGLILAPEHQNERPTAPRDSSMISVAQASDLIGITRAATYKAIERGAIAAIRIGNVTVVRRTSASAYRQRRAFGAKPEAGAHRERSFHVARRSPHAGSRVASAG